MPRRICCLLLTLLVWTACSEAQKGAKDGGSGSSGQSGGKDSGQSGQSGQKGDSGGGGQSGGFSIEAELIAYKALQSDSEAIACDVAGYLKNASTPTPTSAPTSGLLSPLPQNRKEFENKKFKWPPLDSNKICKNAGEAFGKGRSGVIVTSSADATLGNFQLWRVNMAIIQALLNQADHLETATTQADSDTAAHFVAPANVGEVLDAVKSVLGIFAVNESVSGVTGTIQDQALVDGVSRQLRALGVTVVVPGLYSSYTFSDKQTPFLEKYVRLIQKRGEIANELKNRDARAAKRKGLEDKQKKAQEEAKKPRDPKSETEEQADKRQKKAQKDADDAGEELKKIKPDDENNTKQLQALLSAIDAFIARLNGTKESQPGSPTPAPGVSDPASPTKSQQTAPAPSEPSPLAAIVAADGLAERLKQACSTPSPTPTSPTPNSSPTPEGDLSKADSTQPSPRPTAKAAAKPSTDSPSDEETSLLPDACLSKWRVLTLKALESGGTILTGGNLFTGNRVHYSGGSVATYALFQLDGDLSCSGNVYDYGGYISPKKFRREIRKPNIDPDEQLIFFRGRCSSE